ncbi:hypothetical protein NC651_038780 [Populus alba x Populus x berolinensis]|nr:hypothetical protein NC651_038780 [Populus alba x Populus x berolinensis]
MIMHKTHVRRVKCADTIHRLCGRLRGELGVLVLSVDDGDVFMTCNYDPPGNYVGERPY